MRGSSLTLHTEGVYTDATMKGQATYRRVNITLPEETLGLIDRAARRARQNRSRFIDEAVRYSVRSLGHARLRELLEEDARVNRERDLGLVEEWFAVDAETWPGAGRRK
jgi:uncharacterized protein (DUF1778 family)